MSEILSSWKEIATFFSKAVRTVQRWERTAGLPVHRPKPFAVLAYRPELESWLRKNDRVWSSEGVAESGSDGTIPN